MNAIIETTKLTETEIEDIFSSAARGSYQRDLVSGAENWSGASLKGKAQGYGARYAQSREHLLHRANEALHARGVRAETELRAVTGDSGYRRRTRVLVVKDL